MSSKGICRMECSKVILIVGSRLFMKSFMDWSCLVVPRKISKMSIYESLPEGDCPVKGFPDGFFVKTHEEVGVWWGGLGSHCCADDSEKMPVHE